MTYEIGAVSWAWFDDPLNEPTDALLKEVIGEISSLGFDAVELLSTPASLRSFYTDEEARELREYAEGEGIAISGFVFSAQAEEEQFNTADPSAREDLMKDFRRATEVASLLGTDHLNTVAPWPRGSSGPNNARAAADKLSLGLPEDYCWEDDWNDYVDFMREAADVAAGKGLKVSIECFPYTICSTPHAWVRLLEEIDRDNFGIQIDTAHLTNQRHDVITAIHMVGGENILNVHCKDSDAMTRGNLPPGSGIVDYARVLKTLDKVGYEKRLSVEVEMTEDPSRYSKQGLDHLRGLLAE